MARVPLADCKPTFALNALAQFLNANAIAIGMGFEFVRGKGMGVRVGMRNQLLGMYTL